MIEDLLFITAVSLLVLHEMDAVRRREWRLLFVLNRFNDEKAHRWFTALHLPLLVALYSIPIWPEAAGRTAMSVVDIFLIVHLVLHIFFRRHADNEFNDSFSIPVISLASIFGALHLAVISGAFS